METEAYPGNSLLQRNLKTLLCFACFVSFPAVMMVFSFTERELLPIVCLSSDWFEKKV